MEITFFTLQWVDQIIITTYKKTYEIQTSGPKYERRCFELSMSLQTERNYCTLAETLPTISTKKPLLILETDL